MSGIVQDEKPDSTLALHAEGYDFIRNRCTRYNTDVFATRLLLKPVICALGEDAARMFYYPGRFGRAGALPPNTVMLLRDKGSVQFKEGEAHLHRKRLFLNLMSRDSIARLTSEFRKEWRQRLPRWEQQDSIVLHEELRHMLCRASCRWAGIDLSEHDLQKRTREMGAMIDGAGSFGPRNWWALLLRNRSEQWAQQLIDDVRLQGRNVYPSMPLHKLAWHRENGELLSRKTAAVELLNLLRPTVAIARFITFAALALHDYPTCRERLRFGHREYLHFFTQEVRRFYPFFPFVGGRAQESFDWRGHYVAKGTWVILDLYGTNHDERIWRNPGQFEPERFRNWNGSAYNFIPQGGGDVVHGHRCAGEWITIELLKTGIALLARDMRYQVPEQDLTVPMSKVPTLPRSGFVLQKVRTVAEPPQPEPSAKVCPFPVRRRVR